jgi:Spy/CpxP family protein refolding chaperone
MTRTIKTGIVAAALAAAATISIAAQPPQGRGFGGGRMGPGGPGPGASPILRGLNLSDAQREQVRAIVESQRTAEAGPPKLAQLERQLQLAVLADTMDHARVDELRAAIAAAQSEALARRIDVESRIAQVLTPEQRAQAREKLSKTGPPNGAPRGGRRGH